MKFDQYSFYSSNKKNKNFNLDINIMNNLYMLHIYKIFTPFGIRFFNKTYKKTRYCFSKPKFFRFNCFSKKKEN